MGQVCKKEISDIYLPLSEDTSRLIRGSKAWKGREESQDFVFP